MQPDVCKWMGKNWIKDVHESFLSQSAGNRGLETSPGKDYGVCYREAFMKIYLQNQVIILSFTLVKLK